MADNRQRISDALNRFRGNLASNQTQQSSRIASEPVSINVSAAQEGISVQLPGVESVPYSMTPGVGLRSIDVHLSHSDVPINVTVYNSQGTPIFSDAVLPSAAGSGFVATPSMQAAHPFQPSTRQTTAAEMSATPRPHHVELSATPIISHAEMSATPRPGYVGMSNSPRPPPVELSTKPSDQQTSASRIPTRVSTAPQEMSATPRLPSSETAAPSVYGSLQDFDREIAYLQEQRRRFVTSGSANLPDRTRPTTSGPSNRPPTRSASTVHSTAEGGPAVRVAGRSDPLRQFGEHTATHQPRLSTPYHYSNVNSGEGGADNPDPRNKGKGRARSEQVSPSQEAARAEGVTGRTRKMEEAKNFAEQFLEMNSAAAREQRVRENTRRMQDAEASTGPYQGWMPPVGREKVPKEAVGDKSTGSTLRDSVRREEAERIFRDKQEQARHSDEERSHRRPRRRHRGSRSRSR